MASRKRPEPPERDRTRDELLDETLALVSHELRTPLTVISGAARVLERHPDIAGHPDLVPVVDDLRLATGRMTRIVENMLLLSRLNGEPAETEPVLVREAVAGAVNAHRRDFSDAAVRVLGEQHPGLTVMAIPAWLHLVLLNLLNNAHQYGDGTDPTVVSWSADGDLASISVCNAGEAIDGDEYERWFEPFYRGSTAPDLAPGAGLGLAVVRRLVQAQDGQVTAEAWAPTPGTQVIVQLPVDGDH